MSEELQKSLSAKERKRFEQCKQTIHNGLQTCWEVGEALREIRDSKLYREDFSTWEEFTEATHSLGRAYAARLMEAAEVKSDLEDRSPKTAELIVNEAQARALSDVPPEKRVKFVKELANTGEPLTAEKIKDKADSTFSEKPDSIAPNVSPIGNIGPKEGLANTKDKEQPEDEVGTPITPEAMPFWLRRDEVQNLLSSLTKIKGHMQRALDSNDPLYWNILNGVIADLSKTYTHLANAKPYAVCTLCQGWPSSQPKGRCSACGPTGLVSKYHYDHKSPEEAKIMRERMNAKENRP